MRSSIVEKKRLIETEKKKKENERTDREARMQKRVTKNVELRVCQSDIVLCARHVNRYNLLFAILLPSMCGVFFSFVARFYKYYLLMSHHMSKCSATRKQIK